MMKQKPNADVIRQARRANHCARPRAGFSILEVMVAFVVLGIGLSGLIPLAVIQSKHLTKLENRFSSNKTYYLIPPADGWARKLGAAAVIVTEDPGSPLPPPVMILNNGDPGYSESGTGWGGETKQSAFRNDQRTHAAGDGSNTATWSFKGLAPGWYDVRITWQPANPNASNACFTVHEGAKNLGAFTVNQQLPPTGEVLENVTWQSIGKCSLQGNSLQISLSDDADGRVIADGVRVLPVRNVVSINSLEKTMAQDKLTVHVSVKSVVPQ